MSNASNTSRRSALKFGVTAVAAGLTAPAMAKASAAIGEDPVLVLYRQWLSYEDLSAPGEARHEALRDALVSRHGEIMGADEAVHVAWDSDATWREMSLIDARLSHLNAKQADILDEMMTTQPTTKAGFGVKLQFLKKQIGDVDETDPDTCWLFHVLNDALSLLGEKSL